MSCIRLQSKYLPMLAMVMLACTFLDMNLGTEAGSWNNRKPYIVTRWYDLRGEGDPETVKDTPTPHTDCGSAGSDVKNVQVIPCDGEDACILRTGQNATFKLSFVSKINSTKLTAKVHGIVAGVPIPFHVPHADGCTECGIKCPLVEGTSYEYTIVMPILKTYPKLSVTIKWELIDDTNKDVVCVEIKAKLR